MKEYQRIMRREIHTANMRMRRYQGCIGTMFWTYVNHECPGWSLSEQITDFERLKNAYIIARSINSISEKDAAPSDYDSAYERYVWSIDWEPLLPNDWKILEGV